MSCTQCQGIELEFDQDTAQKELQNYHKKGLPKTTGWIVDYFGNLDIKGFSLIDIGGGIGMIQHKLLEDGASTSTHVDGSSAYLEIAKEEAKRLEIDDRIEFHHGDFLEIGPGLAAADIVTLDKVICCFDDMQGLVKASSQKAKKYYGVIFPKDDWWVKLAFNIYNFLVKFNSNPFRIFVHSTDEIDAIINESGLKRAYWKRGFFWQFMVYAR